MHAVTHAADMFNGGSEEHFNIWELFQNYEIYIGNNSDYNQNVKCAGGPFLRTDNPDNYVYDDMAAS